MEYEEISLLLQKIKFLPEHPRFFSLLYSFLSKTIKKDKENIFDSFFAEEYEELSRRVDHSKMQESVSVRNVTKTRGLAKLLINEMGALDLEKVGEAVESLSKHLYFLGPDRHFDAKRNEHVLQILKQLLERKDLTRVINNVTKPFRNPNAEEVIRYTMDLKGHERVTDAHTRQAVLSSWMNYLRQSVGSCFATAPAILIQYEQPELYLKDVVELLETGRLKRVFGGEEYAVPFAHSWGSGDLKRQFFLPSGQAINKCNLWYSPGMIQALEAGNVIAKDQSSHQKTRAAKRRIISALNAFEGKNSILLISPELILQKIILQDLELADEDLEKFNQRPKQMIYAEVIKAEMSKNGLGKDRLCRLYEQRFDLAKQAFKSVADNALLKSWEYTIASFAEAKSQFTSWNLYASLGLGSNEPGGIGEILYQFLKERVDFCNQKVHETEQEYERAYYEAKILESRLRRATEDQSKWLRAEYQSKANEFRSLEEIKNRWSYKGKRLANLFEFLIDTYLEYFPEYFQEVYDPDLVEVSVGPYDDSPAGFRLVYKHGRAYTAQWTRIHTLDEFVESLASFFIMTETGISHLPELENLEREFSEIVSAVVGRVRSKEFIETAFYRMAKAHKTILIKDPLKHLDQIEKKPWVYTSGGSMKNLLNAYFKRQQELKEISRWAESPTELLVFIIDAVKEIPQKELDIFIKDPNRSLLMHSPTHAFLLKPGVRPFSDAWQSQAFTYTWVRDELIKPMSDVIVTMLLDKDMIQAIIQELAEIIPVNFRRVFLDSFSIYKGRLTPKALRMKIIETMNKLPTLRELGKTFLTPDVIDGALFSLLPFFRAEDLENKVSSVLHSLPAIEKSLNQRFLDIYQLIASRIEYRALFNAKTFQNLIKAILCLASEKTSFPDDYHLHIARACQKLGFALPIPIIFADTNWVHDEFGFVVNPGTDELELWRVDYTGTKGAPMSAWKEWVDGSQKSPAWGIYTNPKEYFYGAAFEVVK